MSSRIASVSRSTNETNIETSINLDGQGVANIKTGVGFFDHMLDQIARHALIDIDMTCNGDTQIDDHHSVEDCGIALGQAIKKALSDKAGINRYGHFSLAMDDTLVEAALDFSGRGFLVFNIEFPSSKIGTFDTELVQEFFQALAINAGMTLHIRAIHGINSHHLAEAAFKAVARAMRMAVEPDPRNQGRIPSTKGTI